jgi:hypothetical protein
MAKYPCGICKKNVKYSAILCTGSCNKWLHFKCAKLSATDVKNMEKDDFLGEWKCINCQAIPVSNDNNTTADLHEDNKEFCSMMNFSSLAEEINESVLQSNEELRQELYEERNRSALFILELEDKIKGLEDSNESNKKVFKEKEEDLLNQIKSLERRLKSEREVRESLVLQAEEDANKCSMQMQD